MIFIIICIVPVGPMTTQSAYSGAGQGPVNLAYVSCLGNEASLSDCPSYSGIGVPNCYHGNDVGIKCPGMYMLII